VHRGQVDEPHPVRERRAHGRGEREGQAGLAHVPDPGEGEQPHARLQQALPRGGVLPLPAGQVRAQEGHALLDRALDAAPDRWRREGPVDPFLQRGHPARRLGRRLVPDTVRLLQPAFSPGLPFAALSAPGARGLVVSPRRGAARPLDAAIDRAAGGASVVQVALPARITGEVDEELAATVVALLERLRRGGRTGTLP
jgi:hypothetical protein